MLMFRVFTNFGFDSPARKRLPSSKRFNAPILPLFGTTTKILFVKCYVCQIFKNEHGAVSADLPAPVEHGIDEQKIIQRIIQTFGQCFDGETDRRRAWHRRCRG